MDPLLKEEFPQGGEAISLPAGLDSLEAFVGFVLERAGKAGASEAVLQDIRLAMEEILVNVVSYAYPDEKGRIAVRFWVSPDGMLGIEVTDWGIPFDPLAADAPDLSREFAERDIGGLGIYLARSVAQRMAYKRDRNANRLTVFFLSGQG
ncbi:MAG: ATP-binding protein [Desulfobacteraceae bacterium]|nr:ATP-binding protein [Desulfobacteraceae bacterium]